jgi:hypothetical protein
MNADAFYRAVYRVGQPLKISRLSGTQRIPFTVTCQANVNIGGAQLLVAGVFQTADEIRCGDREMKAMQWPLPPRGGDRVEFQDGHVSTIQGHAMTYRLETEIVYVFRCLGGG